jgi:hypothetical protein
MTIKSNLPYTPTYLKTALMDGRPVQMSYADVGLQNTNINDPGSFKYDPLDFPMKSTQQLNVDWSKFENHTFFSSAEVKVNEAFNVIINSFPFDGTKKEVEAFFDKLTGFEKYVFDRFPTWSGALHFSGTQVGEDTNGSLGTWISVKDKSGYLYPDLSKNSEGVTIINPPAEKSFTIEVQAFLPEIANGPQVILQKNTSNDEGFTLYLEQTAATTYASATFCISSGSFRNKVSTVLNKGAYNHICVTLNKENAAEDFLEFYLNETLSSVSDTNVKIGKLSTDNVNLLIGTGSSFYSESTLVTPTQTFSGTMDELRIFHAVRSPSQQALYATKGMYASPDMKLYYRFNEPPPLLSLFTEAESINSIVLDSSGNSLHANISNFTGSLRVNASEDTTNPVTEEKVEFTKILFPAATDVKALNEELLTAAKDYDLANPNNIIKLIPPHYLLEGAEQDGFDTVEGNAGEAYGGSGIPGQGERGSTQIILTFLYIWAKFFDDIKLFLDSFVTLKTVDYDKIDTVPDNFLEGLVRSYGFYMPSFFTHATTTQYSEGDEVNEKNMTSDVSLKKLQADMLRRILISLPDVVKSKGTQHSIRSFLRSVGIDPDNSLRIREYGGSTTKSITNSREKKTEPGAMVDFTSSSLVVTPFLSGSRVEPGYPELSGSFVYDAADAVVGSTSANDGLFTSGSWTTAALFKYPKNKLASITTLSGSQSLMRMLVTGSSTAAQPGLLFNVVANKKEKRIPANVTLYGRPGGSTSSPFLKLSLNLPGEGIFDGDKWHVSFGRARNDELGADYVSSSYYFRCARAEDGELTDFFHTSSFFHELSSNEFNTLQQLTPSLNASGAYVAIGNTPSINAGVYPFLNDSSIENKARVKDFVGWSSNLKFWSKSVDENEWKEHVKNFRSVGAADPFVRYNFVKEISGSFNQIRIDSLTKQTEKMTDTQGGITFLDYSQRDLHLTGTNFLTSSRVVIGDIFSYGMLSPTFDEASTEDKVRIRSFTSEKMLQENPWAYPTPSYLKRTLFSAEEPQDDVRLSIEFSLVDALDRDIVNMFSTFETLGDAIGDPALAFSPDYPDLEKLRDVYFNRLSERMNFKKFLEFYRWFDISLTVFIEQLLPSKTKYKGTNYVIESHMLERHKHEYRHSENYMGDKQVVRDSLLLQQIVGTLKKY